MIYRGSSTIDKNNDKLTSYVFYDNNKSTREQIAANDLQQKILDAGKIYNDDLIIYDCADNKICVLSNVPDIFELDKKIGNDGNSYVTFDNMTVTSLVPCNLTEIKNQYSNAIWFEDTYYDIDENDLSQSRYREDEYKLNDSFTFTSINKKYSKMKGVLKTSIAPDDNTSQTLTYLLMHDNSVQTNIRISPAFETIVHMLGNDENYYAVNLSAFKKYDESNPSSQNCRFGTNTVPTSYWKI